MFKDKYNAWNSFASAAALNRVYNRFKTSDSSYNYKLFPEINEPQKKMAGRRRYARGGSRFKRRRRFKRRNGILRKIKRINRKLFRKGVFNIETKYSRTGSTLICGLPNPTTATGSVMNIMTQITRGEDFDEMNGGKIFVKNIRMQYMLRAPSTMSADALVRVMVVRDKQPSSQANSPLLGMVNDFYIPNTPTSQSEADLNIMLWRFTNSYTAGRFQVLYSRLHALSATADGYFGKNHFIKKTIRINKPWYTAATEAQTNDAARGPGQLYLIYFSNCMEGAGNLPFLNVCWRASYTDC